MFSGIFSGEIVSKKSPMQLSLDYLHECGWVCQIVKRRLPILGKNITQDCCFGFGDILAYNPALGAPHGIALVQTTSWGNFTARRNKILASGHRNSWEQAGGRIFLHGWGDKGLREEEL